MKHTNMNDKESPFVDLNFAYVIILLRVCSIFEQKTIRTISDEPTFAC